MLIVITSLLLFFLIISVYININLFRKNEKMEEALDDQYRVMTNVRNLIKDSSQRIEEIDKNGAFKSDDEVGFFFKTVKQIQQILSELIDTQAELKK